jgi:hypothetical protein
MAANQPKDWRRLCEAAAREEDSEKLMVLVSEINKLLDEQDLNRNGVTECERDRAPISSSNECAA